MKVHTRVPKGSHRTDSGVLLGAQAAFLQKTADLPEGRHQGHSHSAGLKAEDGHKHEQGARGGQPSESSTNRLGSLQSSCVRAQLVSHEGLPPPSPTPSS
jgi:hypothetical protein